MRLKVIALCLCLAVILAATPLFSCARQTKLYSATAFDCFDTLVELRGYANSREEFDGVFEKVHSLLLKYHKLFDIYNEYAGIVNLASVNGASPDAEGMRRIAVDGELLELIELGISMHEKTDGKLNIALGSVLSLWHSCRLAAADDPSSAALPDPSALAEAADHTDIGALTVNRAAGEIIITDPLLRIDVGAVAKGFAAKKAVELLRAEGISGYLLNAGGTVCPIGAKPSGEKWTVGVELPDLSGYAKVYSTDSFCVVTSGAYQRYYEVDGVRYCHIIDPQTLYPPAALASVCILTDDPALGDALSTALFCLSEADGRALLRDFFPEVRALWIYPDMRVVEG